MTSTSAIATATPEPPTATTTSEPSPEPPTATATSEPSPEPPTATATPEPSPEPPTATATPEPEAAIATPTAEASEEVSNSAIVVTGKPFAEQEILSAILVQVLNQAGIESVLGTTILNTPYDFLLEASADAYWEYTGTALTRYYGQAGVTDSQIAYQSVQELSAEMGLTWLAPATLNNTFALVVQSEFVERYQIHTISQLASHMNQNEAPFSICAEAYFFDLEHSDGLRPMQEAYGFAFAETALVPTPIENSYQALAAGDCEILVGFATDSKIAAQNLVILSDDLPFFPVYNPAPLLRDEAFELIQAQAPSLVEQLACISQSLDDATMAELNRLVELEGQESQQVAQAFLATIDCPLPQPIVITGKPFAEQEILSAILLQVLNEAGVPAILGATILNTPYDFLLEGSADVYWEYTGTALTRYYGQEGVTDSQLAYERVQELSAEGGLTWLNPAILNNTFALLVSPEFVERTQIQSISQLASYMNQNGAPFSICAEAYFFDPERSDGLRQMQAAYGFAFDDTALVPTPIENNYEALAAGQCDILVGFATDSMIAEQNLVILSDDLPFFPVYNPAPLLRQQAYELIQTKAPGVINQLLCISQALDNATMAELNRQVEIEGQASQQVANALLTDLNCSDSFTLMPQEVCQELIVNGEFETQEGWVFSRTNARAAYQQTPNSISGQQALQLGIPQEKPIQHTWSSAYQTITIPSDAINVKLTFYAYPLSQDLTQNDSKLVWLYAGQPSSNNPPLFKGEWNIQTNNQWTPFTFNLSDYAGYTVSLFLGVINFNDSARTTLLLDNVSIEACSLR